MEQLSTKATLRLFSVTYFLHPFINMKSEWWLEGATLLKGVMPGGGSPIWISLVSPIGLQDGENIGLATTCITPGGGATVFDFGDLVTS